MLRLKVQRNIYQKEGLPIQMAQYSKSSLSGLFKYLFWYESLCIYDIYQNENIENVEWQCCSFFIFFLIIYKYESFKYVFLYLAKCKPLNWYSVIAFFMDAIKPISKQRSKKTLTTGAVNLSKFLILNME